MKANNENENASVNMNANVNEPNSTEKRVPVYNLIILDKSGSMHSVRKEAVDAYNETLGTIKAAQQKYADTQEQYVSLALFCNCGIEMVYDKVPVTEAEVMEYEQYKPCCCTPLFDAVGSTVSQLRSYAEAQGDYAALVTIITDGYENASKEWTGEAVKALIEECRKDGWMVSFIGAMEDAEQVAISISIENVIKWTQTHEGTREMSHKESLSREKYMSNLDANICFCMSAPEMSIDERKKSRRSIANEYYKEEEKKDNTKE